MAQFLPDKTTSEIARLQKGELIMWNALPSPGSIPVALDFTQKFAMLRVRLFVLVVVSGAIIVATAVAEMFSRHLAHRH